MKKIALIRISCIILVAGATLTPMTFRRIWPLRKAGTSRFRKRAMHQLSTPQSPFSSIERSTMFPPLYSVHPQQPTIARPRVSMQQSIKKALPQDAMLKRFTTAVYNQDLEQLRSLADQGIYITPEQLRALDFNPLVTAVLSQNKPLVEQLLKMGFDPNFTLTQTNSALAMAIDIGDDDIAQLLIKAGADVNARVNNFSLLEHAMGLGETKITRLLNQYGAQKSGSTLDPELKRQIYARTQDTLITKAALLYNYISDFIKKWLKH